MKLLFLHGWTSVPGGRKPTFLKEHGHEVINPALPDDEFNEAVRIAQAEFDQHDRCRHRLFSWWRNRHEHRLE